MLPLCSAAPSCSSPSLERSLLFSSYTGFQEIDVILEGAKTISSVRKISVDDKTFSGLFGVDSHEGSFKLQATSYSLLPINESTDKAASPDKSIFSTYPDEFDDIVRGFSNRENAIQHEYSCSVGEINGSCSMKNEVAHLASSAISEAEMSVNGLYANDIAKDLNPETIFVIPETSPVDLQPPSENNLLNLQDPLNPAFNAQAYSTPEPNSASNTISSIIADNVSLDNSSEMANSSISDVKSISNVFSDAQQSLNNSIFKAQTAIENKYNSLNTFIKDSAKSATESFENGVNSLFPSAGSTNTQVNDKLADLSLEFKQSFYKAGSLAIDALRQALFSLEDSLSNAATFAVYSYESVKNLLPPEVRNSLNISEEKAAIVLRPVGTAIQKVYILLEAFERSIGFDPNDPITSFVVFLGGSATLGIFYWLLRYGGYSGDLSPQLTLELLKKEKRAVLIDVRPEDAKEKEGIPDLRRGARFRYASVTLPQVSPAEKNQLKNVKHIDDALLAAVIRNLQIVKNGSMVIVMDANGERSKEIARFLRRLGIKRSYLVEGGFRSWVKDGLRIKDLKPETTLTILNEEAEAILEEIKPTPELILGSGLGLLAAIYALAEWEKTLQLIGFVGLGQSIYRRVSSYESSEDLKEDLRLLLTPVRLGAQALSSVAGNSEANRIGLPTSPSSTAVQDRVLQAAAKHGSQPSDSSDTPGGALESSSQTGGESLDLSEA